jgi:hypothetical protein
MQMENINVGLREIDQTINHTFGLQYSNEVCPLIIDFETAIKDMLIKIGIPKNVVRLMKTD